MIWFLFEGNSSINLKLGILYKIIGLYVWKDVSVIKYGEKKSNRFGLKSFNV